MGMESDMLLAKLCFPDRAWFEKSPYSKLLIWETTGAQPSKCKVFYLKDLNGRS